MNQGADLPFMPDAILFSRAAAGDAAALSALVERHARASYNLALHFTTDTARAADLTAQVYAGLSDGTTPLSDPPTLRDLHRALAARAGQESGEMAATCTPPPTPDSTAGTPVLRQQVLAAVSRKERAPFSNEPATEPPARTELAGPAAPAPLPEPPAPRWATPVQTPARRTGGRLRLTRHGDPYRRLDRRSPLPILVALAALTVLLAVGAARSLPTPAPIGTEEVADATWPALPPRVTATVRGVPGVVAANPTIASTATAAPPPPPIPPSPSATTAPPTATSTVAAAPDPPTAEPPAPEATAPPQPPTVARVNPPTLVPPLPVPPQPAPVLPPAQEVTLATTPPPPAATPTMTPARARLALALTDLDLGVEAGPRLLRFTNAGAEPVTWRVTADSTWLEVTPQSGTLAPGATAQVAVTVARGALPTGAYSGNLQVLTGGTTSTVPVTMLVSPTHTTVGAFVEPGQPINAAGCPDPTTHTVTADITSNAPPRAAAVYYALNNGTEVTKALTAKGQHYSATIGPFAEPGSLTYSLVVTEADGTVQRSAAYSLTVQDCPSRVRTYSVTPPAAQPFTLGASGHNVYTFPITQPGNIIVQLAWDGSATRLSTLLYGPRRADQPYDQRTGTKTLAFAYPVTEADVAAGGIWALHLVNYDTGDAAGSLVLTFEPRGVPVPTRAPSPAPTPVPAVPPPAPSPNPSTPPATPLPPSHPASPPPPATATASPTAPPKSPASPTR